MRQSSLLHLSGVVVVEELERDVERLLDASAPAEEKVSILRRLECKKPPTQVIIDTGAGRALRRLSRDEKVDSKVAEEATRVLRLWRAEVERREDLSIRGPVEVECDLDTRERRGRARRRLEEAVGDDLGLLGRWPAKAEKVVFDRCRHLLGQRYDRCIRRLEAELKDPGTRRRLLQDKSFSVHKLVRTVDKRIAPCVDH